MKQIIFIKNVVFGVFLILIWIGMVIYQSFQIESVFTILTNEYSRKSLITDQRMEIYQGSKIVGEFEATENHLGIIGFRFWTYYRLNNDYLIFRIKEIGNSNWYYQNKYKADQFQPNQYFTFGFPVIELSKGNKYMFEIESVMGRPGVAVGISEVDPAYIVKYKYPRKIVLSSFNEFLNFCSLKLQNLLDKAEFKASTLIYLIPFLLYLISLTPAYSIFEKGFRRFIKERFEFTNRLIVSNKAIITSPSDKIIEVTVRFFIAQYRLTGNFLEKIKFFTDIVISTFVLTVHFLLLRALKGPGEFALIILTMGTTLDSLFVRNSESTMVVLLILWIYLIYKYKISEIVFFALSLIYLIVSAILYYTSLTLLTERIIAWVWLFLVLMVGIRLFSRDTFKEPLQ